MDETAFQVLKLSMAGYCCTQIMLKMALDEEEKENIDLLRAVNGLCNGIGNMQKTCGVLTGGIAILGLYAGKGEEQAYPKKGFTSMIDEFIEWFESDFQSTNCRDIIGVTEFKDESNDQGYLVKCGDILGKSYNKVKEILTENDYEFGNRE